MKFLCLNQPVAWNSPWCMTSMPFFIESDISFLCNISNASANRIGRKRLENELLLFSSSFPHMERYTTVNFRHNVFDNLLLFTLYLVVFVISFTCHTYLTWMNCSKFLSLKTFWFSLQTDTSSVLNEAMEYIGFLHKQVKVWTFLNNHFLNLLL